MTGDGTPTERIDELLTLYETAAAGRPYDEAVSELAHALQCADLAAADDASDAMVAAALLHDVGHLLAHGHARAGEPVGDDHHESTGARHLRAIFGPEISGSVALHVAAKRYLCATDPGYLDVLSPGSVHSLAVQGGPMTMAEAEAFRRRPHWDDAVQLRRWDDAAKVAGAPTSALADHRTRLVRLAAR